MSPRECLSDIQLVMANAMKYNQDGSAWKETGIICTFSAGWGWVDSLYGKMLVAARGIDEIGDDDYLVRLGEKIINLERALNVREGLSRKEDTLPQRMLTEPLHTGDAPGEGQIVRHQDEFLDNYYNLRGWTKEGVPTAEKLNALGIGYAAKDMP